MTVVAVVMGWHWKRILLIKHILMIRLKNKAKSTVHQNDFGYICRYIDSLKIHELYSANTVQSHMQIFCNDSNYHPTNRTVFGYRILIIRIK